MYFKIGSDGLLKISEKALSILQQYRQVGNRDKEAGGVLLGRYIQSSRDIVVDLVTHPMKRDIRKRYFFKKCKEDHQNIVQTLWEESEGTCNYLCEWHSHPESIPSPSSHDIKEWKKVLEQTVCDSDKLFFIIVGIKTIEVWVGCRTSLEIKKMIRC